MNHLEHISSERQNEVRFNEHRRSLGRPIFSSGQTTVFEHFVSNNHTPSDMEVIPTSRDFLQKVREAYYKDRMKHLKPKVPIKERNL